MSVSAREFLRHILDECNYLMEKSQTVSFEEFSYDPTLTRAFTRSLEIIGEAVKKVPNDLRENHPELEWKAIAGMRDKLIHSYFDIDFELVWNVVTEKIPALKVQIEIF
jgi:uncharacterized protein with HEPN domain